MSCAVRAFLAYVSTALTYSLALHDALPISIHSEQSGPGGKDLWGRSSVLSRWFAVRHNSWRFSRTTQCKRPNGVRRRRRVRSEEHTSELQSRGHLVCRLLLEKKNYLT